MAYKDPTVGGSTKEQKQAQLALLKRWLDKLAALRGKLFIFSQDGYTSNLNATLTSLDEKLRKIHEDPCSYTVQVIEKLVSRTIKTYKTEKLIRYLQHLEIKFSKARFVLKFIGKARILTAAVQSLRREISTRGRCTAEDLEKITNWRRLYERFSAFTRYQIELKDRAYTQAALQQLRRMLEPGQELHREALRQAVLTSQQPGSAPLVKLSRKRGPIENLPFSVLTFQGEFYCLTRYCLARPTNRSVIKIGLQLTVGPDGIKIHFDRPLAIKIVYDSDLKVRRQDRNVYQLMYGESFRLICTHSYKTHMIMPILPGYSLQHFVSRSRKCREWEDYSKLILFLSKMELCLAVAKEVQKYHAKNWVLMDLSPNNIMLSMDVGKWVVHIIDADDIVPDGQLLERWYGIEKYLPIPYASTKGEQAHYCCDIYGLGFIFAEIFTGVIDSLTYSDKLSSWVGVRIGKRLERILSHDVGKLFVGLVCEMESASTECSIPIGTVVDRLSHLVTGFSAAKRSLSRSSLPKVFFQERISAKNVTIPHR